MMRITKSPVDFCCWLTGVYTPYFPTMPSFKCFFKLDQDVCGHLRLCPLQTAWDAVRDQSESYLHSSIGVAFKWVPKLLIKRAVLTGRNPCESHVESHVPFRASDLSEPRKLFKSGAWGKSHWRPKHVGAFHCVAKIKTDAKVTAKSWFEFVAII